MELQNSHKPEEYFIFGGVRAYKLSYNKFVTEKGDMYRVYKTTDPVKVKNTPNSQGYIPVKYKIEPYGKEIWTTLHQVVARAFIENPNNYEVVDHINEDKTDNRVENLRWTTLVGNNEYYNFREERLLEEYRVRIRELEIKNRELSKTLNDVKAEKEDLLKLKEGISKQLEKKLNNIIKAIDKYANRNMPTDKFNKLVSETKDKKFGSVEKMIKATSKHVYINDVKYDSIREATRFLVTQPNIDATAETVRKEIRKLIRGDRDPWTYKGKYYISL